MSGRFAARYGARAAVSGETGYVDLALTAYAMDTTGTVTLLNTVGQGASVNQRVGKKIVMKGLQCRGYMNTGTTANVNDVALLIVYDKRPTGALPSITDILVSAHSNAMNNDANSGRFRILKRVDAVLMGNAGSAASYLDSMYKANDWWLDLKNLPVVYKAATTGAINDIEEGALYLVTVGNIAAGTAAANTSSTFRLRFKDI
jgi:hypothetical protein